MSEPLDRVTPRYIVPLEVWQQYELLGELRSAEAGLKRISGGSELRNAMEKIKLLEQCREDLTAMVQELIAKLEKC